MTENLGTWDAMLRNERETLDRVALAAELSQLAVSFVDESKQWASREADGAVACIRAAESCSRFARMLDDPTLLAVDLDRARGLAEAATLTLGNLRGARRFLRAAWPDRVAR